MIRLITFEGGDGTGKTTQLKSLENHLGARGIGCTSTREPGGTSLGKLVRQVLVEVSEQPITSPTELFLYLADRAQHVREVIIPALKTGRVVLCDRYTDSTLAYQGYGRGIDLHLLQTLNTIASEDIRPDLTFLLDCPVEVGLSRTAQRKLRRSRGAKTEDRFEREEMEFHKRVRQGFLELARAEPDRIHVIDASRSMQEVTEAIEKVVDQKLL
jgi:dTMP kinase